MRVLVTGGTGVLGRELVPRLSERAEVRVLSRSPKGRPGFVGGDLDTGEGLAAATAGVDVIVHCASAGDYRRPERDVAQVRRLRQALGPARPHLVYISIVGVDRVRFSYFRGKLACERFIEASGLPYTILRATQFHDLVLMMLMYAARGPVALVPRGIAVQSVDVGEVADRLTTLATGQPAGRVPDLGGPRVEPLARLMHLYLEATGRHRPVLRVPLPGRVAADYRAGGHLLGPDGVRAGGTFAEYLRSRVRPDGSVEPPYDLGRRRRQRR